MSEWPGFELWPLTGTSIGPAHPKGESESEVSAYAAYTASLDRDETPEQAAVAGQAAFEAQQGKGSWMWCDNGLVQVGQLKNLDMDGLNKAGRERLTQMYLHVNEYVFQVLDLATRRTGKIVKINMALDAADYSLRNINFKFVRVDMNVKQMQQDLYPQNLECLFFTNPPKSLLWVYSNLVRPMLPAKIKDKTKLLDSASPAGSDILDTIVRNEHRPSFQGGSLVEWPPKHQFLNIGVVAFKRYDEPIDV